MRQVSRWISDGWRRVFAGAAMASALAAGAMPALAAWTPAQLDELDRAFVASAAAGYNVQTHAWRQFVCDGSTDCLGNNPDTTYQIPDFDGAGRLDRTLGPTGALVLLMETPPAMRYFGLTPYMYSKYYTRLPWSPRNAGRIPIAQSMTDTANQYGVRTTGSPLPGVQPFGQLAAFIIAADDATASDLSARLWALGFPLSAINRLDLPVSVTPPVPFSLGDGPLDDTFTVLLRMNYPLDAAAFADYVQRLPVRIHYVEPLVPRPFTPVPPTVFKVPGSGPEPGALSAGRDQLILELLTAYAPQFSSVVETTGRWTDARPFQCLTRGVAFCFDNPDAAYTGTNKSYAMGPDDRMLVVGVDHGLLAPGTGKVAMFSHALNDTRNRAGVVAVPDTWLRGTGLTAAGVVDPSDPRYDAYSRLYAFTLGYRCPPGDPVCVTIPAEGVPGAPPGTPLRIGSRMYLDPATKTRPNVPDLVLERTFLLRK